MAGSAGVDLYRRDAQAGDAVGVNARSDIALDHADAQPTPQRFDGALDEAGLARPGRGHDVQDENALLVEQAPVFLRNLLVGAQNIFNNLDFQDTSPLRGVQDAGCKMQIITCGTCAVGRMREPEQR